MISARGDYIYERPLMVLVDAARRTGLDIDVSALAPTRRRIGDDTLVPLCEYRTVLHFIFADPRETFGIELACNLPVEASGLWGFLLRSSPTFGDLLRRAERYLKVFYHYTQLAVTVSGDHVIVRCDHPEPSPFGRHEQEVCFFMAQWLVWGRALVGENVAAEQVRMCWDGPVDAAPFEDFFRCAVRFGADDNALVFHRRICDMPLPEQSPELTELFEDYAAAMIRRVNAERSFVERVRDALTEGQLAGASNEQDVAEQMGVTRRTLRRRLAEDGLSFRKLRRDVLHLRAERMLRDGRLPVAEVSYLLGYAEPSAFHRAFRRWTGLSPGEWRARQQLPPPPGA
jgi:AraC-like DNA-binding protein